MFVAKMTSLLAVPGISVLSVCVPMSVDVSCFNLPRYLEASQDSRVVTVRKDTRGDGECVSDSDTCVAFHLCVTSVASCIGFLEAHHSNATLPRFTLALSLTFDTTLTLTHLHSKPILSRTQLNSDSNFKLRDI